MPSTPTLDHRFFDPRGAIETFCGNLPHWRQQGVMYFVTFRTADSLPAEKRAAWNAERSRWLTAHPQPWDASIHAEYVDRFPLRLQRWLDAGYGACPLKRDENSEIIARALRHFEGDRYRLDDFVVAANHVHALVVPAKDEKLSAILHSLKSYTGNAINRLRKTGGQFWQQESYDHIVRDERALHRLRQYIRNHPEAEKEGPAAIVLEETRQDASSTAEDGFAVGKTDPGGSRVDEASRLVTGPA